MTEKTLQTTIHDALEALRPDLEKRYQANVRSTFAHLIETFGPAVEGIYKSHNYQSAHVWRHVCAPVVRHVYLDEAGNPTPRYSRRTRYELDEARLEKESVAYAQSVALHWEVKILGKLQEMEQVEVRYLDGHRFSITGTRAGQHIQIEQSLIIKRSTKGLLFNQWPARIYVDGKFTPEAAYKRLFKAEVL
jgi:hypothetical protein